MSVMQLQGETARHNFCFALLHINNTLRVSFLAGYKHLCQVMTDEVFSGLSSVVGIEALELSEMSELPEFSGLSD